MSRWVSATFGQLVAGFVGSAVLLALAAVSLLAAPSLVFAGDGPTSKPAGQNLSQPVRGRVMPDAGVAGRTLFHRDALVRAVARATEAPGRARLDQTASATGGRRDSLANGALIGAAIGAVAGAALAASDDCGLEDDYGGGCAMLAGPAIGGGLLFGALIGAGIGALVDAAIR